MRRPGTGTVSPLPSGRFRPRLPGREGRFLPTRDTREEAERDLDIALGLLAQGVTALPSGTLLGPYGRAVLLRRKGEGYRNAGRELSRWATHVEGRELGRLAVETLTRREVVAWLREIQAARARRGRGHVTHRARPVSRSVVIDALRILRAVLRAAVEDGVRETDPTAGVRVGPDRGCSHDPWTWLTPGEVVRLIEVGRGTVSEDDHDAAITALYTGLREGELWALPLRDVDLPSGRVVVRYGSRGRPTKGGRPRTLVLLPPALAALGRQIARVTGRPNPHGLVFPSAAPQHRGAARAPRAPRCWAAWLARAGLTPSGRGNPIPVTWHSLRHTFATLALAGRLPGCEGEGWRLERVSAYLGHRSIAITQRYADVAALL